MTQVEYNDFLMNSFIPFGQIRRHNDIITSIDFSPCSNQILTGGNDNLISLYSLTEGKTLIEIHNNFYGVKCVCFTNEPNKILCAGRYDNRIMLIDTKKNEIEFSFFGHNKPIDSIVFSKANNLFITNSSEEMTSVIWNYTNRNCYCLIKNSITACFDYFGDLFVSLSPGKDQGQGDKVNNDSACMIKLYKISKDTHSMPPILFKSFTTDSISVNQMKIANNAEYIVCYGKREMNVYKTSDGQCIIKNKNDDCDYKCLDITPDSKFIMVIDSNDCQWYYNSKGEVIRKVKGIDQQCQVIKFSAGYAFFAIGSEKVTLYAPNFTVKESKTASS